MTKVTEEEEASIASELVFDERVAVRRLAFRNYDQHDRQTRVTLPLDLSVDSMAGLRGAPPWLVGSIYYLIPAVFDIHYWRHDLNWRHGIVSNRVKRSIEYLDDCLKMILQIEFLEPGQVQFKSQLLAKQAYEEWKRAEGDPNHLDGNKVAQVLQGRTKGLFSAFKKGGRAKDLSPDAVVVQSGITSTFPMGTYHGVESRLVLHQTGGRRIQILDSISSTPKQVLRYQDLDPAFKGIPCPKPLIDPESKELVNVLIEYHGPGNYAKYRVISCGTGTGFQLLGIFLAVPVKAERIFAITTDYVIVMIHPYGYQEKQPNFHEANIVYGADAAMHFGPTTVVGDTLFYVISRKDRCLVAVYRNESTFVIDVVNASKGENSLFIGVLVSDAPKRSARVEDLSSCDFDQSDASRQLRRYCLYRLNEEMARFDGAIGQLPVFPLAAYYLLTDYDLTLPMISSLSIGSPYRFIYGLTVDREHRGVPGYFPNSLLKCDLQAPSKSMIWHKRGFYPMPPAFVPRKEYVMGYTAAAASSISGSKSIEDDGALVFIALDVLSARSYLLVLDARDLCELARYVLPRSLPLTWTPPAWSDSRTVLTFNEQLMLMTERPTAVTLAKD